MPTPLDNLSPEAFYRYQERLGILCGSDEPTEEQHSIALLEALQYERQEALDRKKAGS
jgi:hypothetical protein